MPTPDVFTPPPLIPPGEHVLILREVKPQEVKKYQSETEKEVKWLWRFEAQGETYTDAKGEEQPYEFVQWTKITYGPPKANLTKLLDQLIPGIDEQSAAILDTDDLCGRRFKAIIRHEKNEKKEVYATLAVISPMKGAKIPARAKPKDFDPDDEDMTGKPPA